MKSLDLKSEFRKEMLSAVSQGIYAWLSSYYNILRGFLRYWISRPTLVSFWNDNVLLLEYRHLNRMYQVYLPYSRRNLAKHVCRRVFLIRRENDTEKLIELSQQPGIKYFVTARQLEGVGFEVHDEETVKRYTEDEYIDDF